MLIRVAWVMHCFVNTHVYRGTNYLVLVFCFLIATFSLLLDSRDHNMQLGLFYSSKVLEFIYGLLYYRGILRFKSTGKPFFTS